MHTKGNKNHSKTFRSSSRRGSCGGKTPRISRTMPAARARSHHDWLPVTSSIPICLFFRKRFRTLQSEAPLSFCSRSHLHRPCRARRCIPTRPSVILRINALCSRGYPLLYHDAANLYAPPVNLIWRPRVRCVARNGAPQCVREQ